MKQNGFERVLQYFKDHEQPESVLMVAGSMSLIRIILCWSRVKIRQIGPLKACNTRGDEEKWAWLWSNVSYRRDHLLASIPSATDRTEKELDALIASRILYPDGTINSFVQKYLQQRTLQVFGARQRKGHGDRVGTR